MRRRKNNTRPVNAEAIEAAEREFTTAASAEAFELAAKELVEAREALRPLIE